MYSGFHMGIAWCAASVGGNGILMAGVWVGVLGRGERDGTEESCLCMEEMDSSILCSLMLSNTFVYV